MSIYNKTFKNIIKLYNSVSKAHCFRPSSQKTNDMNLDMKV